MTEQEQCNWSSFMPALLACIGATKGPVLELGVGHFSTPALHALCEPLERDLISLEQDPEWYQKFNQLFNVKTSKRHLIYPITYEGSVAEWAVMRWGVSFIDHSPGGENRKQAFEILLPKSEYVVVHDYHRDNEEAIGPLLDKVPFKHVTRTYEPPTLVASLTKPIPESILCL